jgi:outer membrane cobalamin receptor
VVTDEQQIGKFRLDAGFRMISGYIVEWGGFGIEGSGTGFDKVEPIEDEPAPFEWQSALGASYPLTNSSSLHYNFSGGTIAPRKGSLTEEGKSPETETRLQHDLGFRYKSQSQHEITLSAFYTQRNNAINYNGLTITLGDGQIMELYENLDKRSYGMELATKWNIPILRSSLFANAMLMKGEMDDEGTMKDDVQLPKVILNTGFYFDYSGFDANFFVNYTGPYTNNRFVNPKWVKDNGDFPLGDFVSADLTAGYTFKGRFSKRVFVEVKNILDQEYMTVAGYPDQGRLFMAGIKINY